MGRKSSACDAIAVLGAGAWGTALALVLARNGHGTVLWGRDGNAMARMSAERCNERYLPGRPFPECLRVSGEFETAVGAVRDVLIATPSHAFRETVERLQHCRGDSLRVAWATKGLEPGCGRLLHEVAAGLLGDDTPSAVLSGPTFAAEVARNLPAAVTIASRSHEYAADLAARFHGERFRVYTSTDIVGVQVGGALKNVLALAAGIADGLGFGANTRAALITRGLAELMRFGAARGGRRETFMGLAGLGDLVLTCTDDQSRNRRAGLIIGRGGTLAQARAEVGPVIEGVRTAIEVMRVARELGVEMPIVEQVERVLDGGVNPSDAVGALLARAPGWEVT